MLLSPGWYPADVQPAQCVSTLQTACEASADPIYPASYSGTSQILTVPAMVLVTSYGTCYLLWYLLHAMVLVRYFLDIDSVCHGTCYGTSTGIPDWQCVHCADGGPGEVSQHLQTLQIHTSGGHFTFITIIDT